MKYDLQKIVDVESSLGEAGDKVKIRAAKARIVELPRMTKKQEKDFLEDCAREAGTRQISTSSANNND